MLNPILEYDGVDLFIAKKAALKMLKHCRDFKDMQLEVMGFMVGHRYNWEGREHTVVEDVVTSDLNTTAISVKFASFEPLFGELDRFEKEGKDYILVGWYHSHPGHTCFMSPTDKDTQIRMFNKKFQSAVVIDPISIEMKAFQLMGSEIYEKPYAILVGPDTLEERKLPRIVIPEEVEARPEVEMEVGVEVPYQEYEPAPEVVAAEMGMEAETAMEVEVPYQEYEPAPEVAAAEMGMEAEMEMEAEVPYQEYEPAPEAAAPEMWPRTVKKIRRVVRRRTVRKRVKRSIDEADVIW